MITKVDYWDIGGVPLNTLAYNITTWGGDMQAPPPLRGDDLTIPYRPGQVFQARRPDGRSVTLDMWVVGADADGNVPTDHSLLAEFQNNLATLRTLFWNQGKQFQLTKRWTDYTTGTLKSATAMAVYAGGFIPAMTGGNRATFSVELYLSDPFFYGPQVTLNLTPAASTINLSTIVEGDFETTEITIDFSGIRNNFRLTNTTESTYVNVNYNMASPTDLVRLDIDNWTARKNPSSSNTNVIGSVTSFGHPFWFVLRPGSQSLSLTSTSGTGTATVKYQPKWI